MLGMVALPHLATLVVRTRVAATTLNTTLGCKRSTPVFCKIGVDDLNRLIPLDHNIQDLQQAAVTGVSHVFYIVASEAGFLFTVIAGIL